MKRPSIVRSTLFFMRDAWLLVMDARYNPLRYIPDPSLQTYFTIVLFSMWSAFFALIAAYWGGWLGTSSIIWSIMVHAAIIIPLSFTNAVFVDAERSGAHWVQQWKEERNMWKWWKNRKKEVRIKWDLDKEA